MILLSIMREKLNDRMLFYYHADGKWKRTHTLGHMRQNTPSWDSPQGVLLMGGDDGKGSKKSMKTTELLTDDGSSKPSFTLANKRT